jgi:hypothetical protein
VIIVVGKRVGSDVHIVDVDLAVLNTGIGICEICPALAKGFYLRTNEYQTGLVFVFDEIIEPGLAVFSNYLFVFFSQVTLFLISGITAAERFLNPVSRIQYRVSSIGNPASSHQRQITSTQKPP